MTIICWNECFRVAKSLPITCSDHFVLAFSPNRFFSCQASPTFRHRNELTHLNVLRVNVSLKALTNISISRPYTNQIFPRFSFSLCVFVFCTRVCLSTHHPSPSDNGNCGLGNDQNRCQKLPHALPSARTPAATAASLPAGDAAVESKLSVLPPSTAPAIAVGRCRPGSTPGDHDDDHDLDDHRWSTWWRRRR